MRAASYNIRGCRGADGRHNADRVARVLQEIDAGVCALQEVDSRGPLARLRQLERIAAEAGYQALPGPIILSDGGTYGNALLTRRRVLEVRRHDLSIPGREPRGVLEALLEWEGLPGGRLRAFALHFGLSRRERREQTRAMLGILNARTPDEPTLVMGDFNEWFSASRNLQRLRRALGDAPNLATFPARWPLFALDRIWARPRGLLGEPRVHRSALARIASDHLPLYADIAADPVAQPENWTT